MRDYHIVVLGAGGVGKSSLTMRYIRNTFEEIYDPTIEEAYTKTTEVNGALSRVTVIDTAGVEQFTAVVGDMYLKPGRGYLLVFSLADYTSYRELVNVYQEIRRHDVAQEHAYGAGVRAPVVLVGTKCDLEDERQVNTDDMIRQAMELHVPYFETSAKENINVEGVFGDVTRRMAVMYPEQHPAEAAVTRSKKKKKSTSKSKKGKCVVM